MGRKSRTNYRLEKIKAKRRVGYMADSGFQYFAPTISPTDKDIEDNKIESLKKGLQYYTNRGVKKIFIQKKHMGSYTSIYLYKDSLQQTKFFSRNGYTTRVDRDVLLNAIKVIRDKFFKLYPNASKGIIEAELLPWNSMASKLIEKDFNNYSTANKYFYDKLKELNIVNEINCLYELYPKKESELKQHEKQNLLALQYLKQTMLPLYSQDLTNDFEAYDNEVKKYANQDNVHFKVFNILKVDGEVFINDEVAIKNADKLNDDNNQIQINFDTPLSLLSIKLTEAEKWQEKYANQEGIIIRPVFEDEHINEDGKVEIPVCMKVRNNSYLRMIYGFDFEKDYGKYIAKRDVSYKLKCSMRDFSTSIQLLKLSDTEIQQKSEKYVKLLYKVIGNEKNYEKLDKNL